MKIVDKKSGKMVIGIATYRPMKLDEALAEIGAEVIRSGKQICVRIENEYFNYKDLKVVR